MPPSQDTVSRILNGALRALARHGRNKFSMSDICDEAGISRGTLYRYFKNKEDVLEAIGRHVRDGYRQALEEAVGATPDPADRLRVVLDVIVNYPRAHPEAALALQAEPEFALSFLGREFPNLLAATATALDPVLRDAPVVADGVVTKNQLAEIFFRAAMSTFFVPSAQSGKLPQRVADVWAAVTAPAKAAPRKRPTARAS